MAAATWRSLAKRAAMWRSLAKSLLAAARKMGALAEMAASPAAQEEVVVVAASGAALPSRRANIMFRERARAENRAPRGEAIAEC